MLKKIMDNTKRNVNEINTCAVELKNVGERYNVFHHKIDSIKEKILKRMSIGKGTRQELWALKDISLTIKKGEVVGIIGENGSGKTTLLKLIAGILKPDRGNIHINGTIAAILQLGVGFHRDLTGRENIYLNGAMLGIDTETIKSKIDQMISFAELEDFIDMPLKTYSSGMEMRLGFSIAVNVDPDILLIDEVLIIGDVAFQQKCMHHIETLKGRGKTIVVVSHSMNLIDQMCDRTFLLRKGELICRGKTREVINYYYQCSGRKRGIALASYADVELIFNNGRLFIFWKKRAITPDPGMYVSITRGETRFYSFQAYWKMKTSSPTSFEAEGFLEALSTTITWKTNLGPDGSLYFDIHVQTEASAQEMDVKFITLFDSDYESWFCNVKRGVFSAMYHGDEMCLHSTMVRRGDFFGVDVAHDKDDVLPGMIFSMTEEKNIISFSHKAINGNSHCLELNFSKGKRRSALIKGNISLFTDITKIDEIVRRIEEKATIQNNTIRLHFDDYDSAIKVFYQDCEITQGKGFYTSLLYQNIWYNSSAMKWHRERVSPSSMKLIGTMPNIPVVQEWLFELHDNRLDVKTVMETTEGGTFSHPQLVVLANKEYNEWFQNISKGVCLDFRHDIPWEEIPLPHDISVDFFAIAQDKGDVPALIFTDYSKNPNIKRSLSNTMQQGPARAVSFISNAQVSRETFYIRFYFDEYDLLSNIVRAILGLYVLEILLAFEAHSITEGAVQVVFEEKQLRIFFDSEEVTGGVGFYSSLRVGNLWHNSSTMRWHYEKISSQCMKLTTTKKTPAVFQEFIFEVTKDALEIKAVMKTTDGNMFSQPQLVLLANKEYGEWFYNSAQGRCFDFKHDMISEEMPLPSDADVSFFALASDEGDKPAFTFTDCRKNGAGRIVLYNTLEHGAARALSFILDVQTSQEEFHVLVNFLSKATLKRLIQPKMQSILDSQSITSERLQVVFETQRWRVLFDGEEVTTGVGFYSLLKVNNIWYNSSSIKWQREKISPQCMKIRGVIRSASVHQEWLFEAKENELEIKLLMEADDSEFSNAQVVILAHKEYNEWFLNKSNGKCFDIKHDVRWEDIPLPSDAEMEFFAMTAKQKNIPGLMVAGCMNQGIQLNLSNTTQQGVGRALRFVSNKKLSREEFHVRFAFLSTKRLHKLISEKQKTLVEKNSITAGRIKILFNDDRLSIYADGKELSGGVGFYSLLQSNHNWYSSSTIKWEMEKVAPRCMKLTGCMKSISVKQEILFEVGEKGFEIKVMIEAEGKKTFSQPQVVVLVNQEYEEWFYNMTQGRCFDFKYDTVWEEIPLPDEKEVAFFALAAKGEDKPAFLFTDCTKNERGRVALYNTLEHGAARAIGYISNVQASREEFCVRFDLVAKEELQRILRMRMTEVLESRSIQSGPLQVVFEAEKWKVLYKGEEVTAGIGFYSLLQLNNIWYNSSGIKWEREKLSSQRMKLKGTLQNTTVQQEWLFEIRESGLEIKLLIKSTDGSGFTNTQFVMMANREYNEWFYNVDYGKCLDFRYDTSFEEISLPNDEAVELFALTAEQEHMPALILTPLDRNSSDMRLSLGNIRQREIGRAVSVISEEKVTEMAYRIRFDFVGKTIIRKIMHAMLGLRLIDVLMMFESRSIQDGTLQVLCEESRMRIYIYGEEITENVGFASSLQINGSWYNSLTIQWIQKKISQRSMKLTGFLENTSIIQEVLFEIKENQLEINAVIEATDKRTFSQTQFRFFINKKYKEWFYNINSGKCFEFMPDTTWEEIPLPNETPADFFAITAENENVPALMVTDCTQNRNVKLSLYNAVQPYAARVLNFSINTDTIREDVHVCFNFVSKEMIDHVMQTISVLRMIEVISIFDSNSITSGLLQVLFEEHATRIFYDGKEVTESIGLYSSVQCGDFIYDISKFQWKRQKVTSSSMKLIWEAKNLPIIQAWMLEVKDNTLEVQIMITTSENSSFSYPQFGFLVNSVYDRWLYNITTDNGIDCKSDSTWDEHSLPNDLAVDFLAISAEQEQTPVIIFNDCQENRNARLSLHRLSQHGISRAVNYLVDTNVQQKEFHVRFDFVSKKELDRIVTKRQKNLEEHLKNDLEKRTIRNHRAKLSFNKGKFCIFAGGTELTKKNGLSSSFRINDNLYHSISAFDWEYQIKDDNTLKCVGKTSLFPLTQIWQAQLQDNIITFTCKFASHKELTLKDVNVECIVQPFYEQWLMGITQAPFVSVKGDIDCANVPYPSGDWPEIIGVRTVQAAPNIIIRDMSDNSFHPMVINFNDELGCRSLNAGKSSITIRKGEEKVISFTVELINNKNLDSLLKQKQHMRTLQQGTIKLFFYDKKVQISKNGNLVTDEHGMYSVLRIKEQEYYSLQQPTTYTKRSESKMEFSVAYPFGRQICTWTIQADDSVTVTIDFDFSSFDCMYQFHFFLQLQKVYSNDCILRDGSKQCMTPHGLISGKSKGNFYLLFKDENHPQVPLAIGGGFNCSDTIEYEIHDVKDIHCKRIAIRKPIHEGEGPFQCDFIFDTKACYFHREQISNKDTIFWIKHESNSLLSKTKEITRSMGLYCSYYDHQTGWNDCIHHAVREYIKLSHSEMRMVVKWKQIPMEQLWIIKFISADELSWRIINKVYKEFLFEKEQFNVMLSPLYQQWMLNGKKGNFPDVFSKDYGGDWECVGKSTDCSQPLTIFPATNDRETPIVTVNFTPIKDGYSNKIINSDDMFQGRVLQCSRNGQILMNPGEYDYFESSVALKLERKKRKSKE